MKELYREDTHKLRHFHKKDSPRLCRHPLLQSLLEKKEPSIGKKDIFYHGILPIAPRFKNCTSLGYIETCKVYKNTEAIAPAAILEAIGDAYDEIKAEYHDLDTDKALLYIIALRIRALNGQSLSLLLDSFNVQLPDHLSNLVIICDSIEMCSKPSRFVLPIDGGGILE